MNREIESKIRERFCEARRREDQAQYKLSIIKDYYYTYYEELVSAVAYYNRHESCLLAGSNIPRGDCSSCSNCAERTIKAMMNNINKEFRELIF